MSAEFRVNDEQGRTFMVRVEQASWAALVRVAISGVADTALHPPLLKASDARLLGHALIAAADEADRMQKP